VDEDAELDGQLSGTAVPATPFTCEKVGDPSNGSVVVQADCKFKYIPNSHYNGPDSFEFRIVSGNVNSAAALASITVNPINDAPVAKSMEINAIQNTPLLAKISAKDEENDPLTFRATVQPLHGALMVFPDGNFKYEPELNYIGPDSFKFKANDGNLDSNEAIVVIDVLRNDAAPIAEPGAFRGIEDTPIPGQLVAKSPGNKPLTYMLVSGPSSGQLAINANGSFVYTPNLNFNGTDSFVFKANDGLKDSNNAIATLDVRPVNDAPVAQNLAFETDKDTPLNANAVASDVDNNNNQLVFRVTVPPMAGANAVMQVNGSFLYTPAPGYVGPDSFKYIVSDPFGLNSAEATVRITVKDKVVLVFKEVHLVSVDPMSPFEYSVSATINGVVVKRVSVLDRKPVEIIIEAPAGSIVIWTMSLSNEKIQTVIDGLGPYESGGLKGHKVTFDGTKLNI